MNDKDNPLSEDELQVIERYAENVVTNDTSRLIATIRDLQGEVKRLRGTLKEENRLLEGVHGIAEASLAENKAMRDSIANVMAAYEAAPDRALTYDRFKDIMADTIVRGTP